MPEALPEPVRLALEAMATRFELVVDHADPVWARAAGEEALREIALLEEPLSFYRPHGSLGRLNRDGHEKAVRVPAPLLDLLERCAELHGATGGCFDPTVGRLMQAWGLAGGRHRVLSDAEVEASLRCTGFDHVHLDREERTVRFQRAGLAVDLGGVAKGYAVDAAMVVLAEAGIHNALLHGGTSTVRAIGDGPGGQGWRIGIPVPEDPERPASGGHALLTTVTLRDEALSVSEISGKGFEADGAFHGHLLDPRTGRPVRGGLMAVVIGPSATDADALSTALLVLGRTAGTVPAFRDPRYRWLVALRGTDGTEFVEKGLPPSPARG